MKKRILFAEAALSLLFPSMLLACGGGETKPPEEEPVPHFDYPLDDVLRLHHVQAKTSHNSYHVANPELSDPEYKITQDPLDVQLNEQGVRGVEIDINYNPDTGVFRVYHIVLIDEGTNCPTLDACLKVMKDWSDTHRAHHPITVQLEIKDVSPAPEQIEPYFEALHSTILSVWPRSRILTPDDVQGTYPTLGDAVRTEGFPLLGDTRGKVLFMLYNLSDGFGTTYSRDKTSLKGRLAFTRTEPTDAIAAMTLYDNPVSNAAAVDAALKANMIVRSRAETSAVNPTPEHRDAAFASGATLLATDYPKNPGNGSYWVEIPGGTPSRCNPITAPPECTSLAIEDPKYFEP